MSKLLQSSLFDLEQRSTLPKAAMWAPSLRRVTKREAAAMVAKHHYAGGIHNGPLAWGCFRGDELRGVVAFAAPCSEATRAAVFGEEHKDSVIELHRLVVAPDHPKNFTSWFVSRVVRLLVEHRPQTRAVLSFADMSEGHTGAIYRACNFLYTGTTGAPRRFWRDPEGRLRHPRQSSRNITAREAAAMGWVAEMREPKRRFILIVGRDRRERRVARARLRYEAVEGVLK